MQHICTTSVFCSEVCEEKFTFLCSQPFTPDDETLASFRRSGCLSALTCIPGITSKLSELHSWNRELAELTREREKQ